MTPHHINLPTRPPILTITHFSNTHSSPTNSITHTETKLNSLIAPSDSPLHLKITNRRDYPPTPVVPPNHPSQDSNSNPPTPPAILTTLSPKTALLHTPVQTPT